jgi:hypothetical protein
VHVRSGNAGGAGGSGDRSYDLLRLNHWEGAHATAAAGIVDQLTGDLMVRLTMIAVVFGLVYPAYAQQSSTQQHPSYRLTENTQACDRRNSVPLSVERAKHGIGMFKFGCAPVAKDHEVLPIRQKGEETLVELCTPAGCNHQWVMSTMLAKIDK